MYSQESSDPNTCMLDLTLGEYEFVINKLKKLKQQNIVSDIITKQTPCKLYRTVSFHISDDVSNSERNSIFNFYKKKYGLIEEEKRLLHDIAAGLTKVEDNVNFYLEKKYEKKKQYFERAMINNNGALYNTRTYARRGSKYIKNINKKFAEIVKLIKYKTHCHKYTDWQNGVAYHTVRPRIMRNAEEARELMAKLIKYSADRNNVDASLFELKKSIPNNTQARTGAKNKKSRQKD